MIFQGFVLIDISNGLDKRKARRMKFCSRRSCLFVASLAGRIESEGIDQSRILCANQTVNYQIEFISRKQSSIENIQFFIVAN